MSLLRIEDISIEEIASSLGAKKILSGFSLDLERGENHFLLGLSGAGKTTAVMAAAGLLAPHLEKTAGKVWDGEREVTALSKRDLFHWRRARVGILFQEAAHHFDPIQRVERQIQETAEALSPEVSLERIRESLLAYLHRVCLDKKLLRRYPHELSGGEKKCLAFFLISLARPAWLFLDEPTSALDTHTASCLVTEILAFQREVRCGVLWVTHDRGLCEKVGGRVSFLSPVLDFDRAWASLSQSPRPEPTHA